MHSCLSGAQVGVVKRGSRLEGVRERSSRGGLGHLLVRNCLADGSEVPRFCHWQEGWAGWGGESRVGRGEL